MNLYGIHGQFEVHLRIDISQGYQCQSVAVVMQNSVCHYETL